MEGGIRAWDGLVAEGPPEAGMAHFGSATGAGELAALAWYLEAGSRAFYAGIAAAPPARADAPLFDELARAEERHLEALAALYGRLAGPAAREGFPQSVLAQDPPDAVMEGGVAVAGALDWARGKEGAALLEYCVALETNSWDLYLRMHAASRDQAAREVFGLLAEEEKRHLGRLTARFEGLDDGRERA